MVTTRSLRFQVTSAPLTEARTDLVVLPLAQGASPDADAHGLGIDRSLLSVSEMTGARGQVLSVPRTPTSVLVVGTGGPDLDALRDAAMLAGAAARPHRTVTFGLPPLADAGPAEAARAVAEGFLLGSYRFDGHRSSPQPLRTTTVRLVAREDDKPGARRGAKQGDIVGRATNLARDLTNMPASEATPSFLASEAVRIAKRLGLAHKTWTRNALERGGFGGILAVGKGSEHDPRMVELRYQGAGRAETLAVTGKGVTFDSGGLNIKKQGEMSWMRSDMAGAACALATIQAVAELGVKVNLVAVLPLAENLPGPTAVRPGDVVRHRGGRTSEVIDTDAEGRVLLADALAYLSESKPAVILDSATLTDASGMGPELFAVMGSDRVAVGELVAAGAQSGEPGWEIPLWTRYRRLIDSASADVKNLGDYSTDSSMMAGLFLRDFVGEGLSWVHVDSGSTAWAEHGTELWPEGATGSPTRAFVRFIENRADGR
jgi:leucyl aminopeptidase